MLRQKQFSLYTRVHKDGEAAGTAASPQGEEELKRKGLIRLLSILPALLAVITFMLTENMRNPMVFVDKWTLLML